MFRRPGTGRSKASADTLCQKCLKRGHYSYECTTSAQERPYKSRPSRTQQLLNPNLQPKLTTQVPTELLRKKGVADEILKKKEEDRRRSRSPSSSADSVSTISTNRSPSRSPSPPPRKHNARQSRQGHAKARGQKRRRQSDSMDSRSSDSEGEYDRNTRRRMSSFSPGERGRRRSRSQSSRLRPSIEDGAARFSRDRSGSAHSRSRATRRRERSHDKPPHRRFSPLRSGSRSRSRSRTPDRMDISEEQPRNGAPSSRGRWGASPPRRPPPPRHSRDDRSPSPYSKRVAATRQLSPPSSRHPRNSERDYHNGEPRAPPAPARNRFADEPVAMSNHRTAQVAQPPPAPVQRQRSLSPFSKRVALTRAMQAG